MIKHLFFFVVSLYINTAFSQNKFYYYQQTASTVGSHYAPNYYTYWQENDSLYHVTDYYHDGKICMISDCKSINPMVRNGKSMHFANDGKLLMESIYDNNKLSGTNKIYHNNRLWLVEQYKDGTLHGITLGYYPSGALRRMEKYEAGKMVDGKCYTLLQKDTVFYPKKELAEFKGGNLALANYLSEHIKPTVDIVNNSDGIVYCSFLVTADGNIRNITISRSVYPAIDNEVVRVVSEMPKWIPGKIEGLAADTWYSLPVSFTLKKN